MSSRPQCCGALDWSGYVSSSSMPHSINSPLQPGSRGQFEARSTQMVSRDVCASGRTATAGRGACADQQSARSRRRRARWPALAAQLAPLDSLSSCAVGPDTSAQVEWSEGVASRSSLVSPIEIDLVQKVRVDRSRHVLNLLLKCAPGA